jgi:cysteine dioxygenase
MSLIIIVKSCCRRLDLETEEWKPYALKDSSRHYTRNLIATDHTSYTLLLLCWNPGHHSPIHDHPCDGCWMKVLQGQIQECRYRPDGDSQRLVVTQDTTQTLDDIVYIEDSMGFHKVGNPHPTETAYTLHLYSPPIQSCRIWLNETMACACELQNYSAYGKKLE